MGQPMFKLSRGHPWQFFLHTGLPISLLLGGLVVAGTFAYINGVRERAREREVRTANVMASVVGGALDHKQQMLQILARSVPRNSVSFAISPAVFANEFDSLTVFDSRGGVLAGPPINNPPAVGEVRSITSDTLVISARDPENAVTWVGAFRINTLNLKAQLGGVGAENTQILLISKSGQLLFNEVPNGAGRDVQEILARVRSNETTLADRYIGTRINISTQRGQSGIELIVQEPWDTLIDSSYLYWIGLPLSLMLMTIAGTLYLTHSQRNRSERQQLRAYAHALTQAQEAERARLARELHDDTIQNLVALHQRVQLARMDSQRDAPTAIKRFDGLRADIVTMIDNVRRYSHALRPIYLEESTLAAALQRLVSESDAIGSRNSPPCRVIFMASDRIGNSQSDVKLTMFRIAQEAITNALKHAQSTQILVRLEESGSPPNLRPRLLIEDNGRGFSVDTALNGLGLINMRERATLIGAKIDVASAPLQGTHISVTIL